MPGSLYGTFTYTDVLGQMVNRHVEKEISESATYAPVGFQVLERECSSEGVTGSHIEWVLNAGDPARSVNFEVFGNNDGQTAAEPDNKITCQSKLKYTGEHFKVSQIKLSEAGGKEAQFNYAKEQAMDALLDVRLKLNRNIYLGDPTVNTEDPFGLDYTINYTGNYANNARTLSRALVGNLLDADEVADRAVSAVTSTITKGSASVTLGSSQTWTAGDIVTISDGTVTMKYYATNSGSGATALTIAPQIDNSQSSTASATVTIQAPFYKAGAGWGAAGAFDLGKINRAIALATDNAESPDQFLGDSDMYSNFMDETLATERSITRDDTNRLGPVKADGFQYRTGTVQQDNNIAAGTLYGLNTKYLALRGNKDFLPLELYGRTLHKEASASPNSFANLLGSYIVSRQLICKGVNRQFKIVNMDQ